MTNQHHLPSGFSIPSPDRPEVTEDAFRRYEQIISKVIYNFPRPQLISPDPFSPYTVSHRMRDAISARMSHPEWRTTVSIEDLSKVFRCAGKGGSFIFRVDPETRQVYCGPNIQTKLSSAPKVLSLGDGSCPEFDDEEMPDIVNALAILKNAEILTTEIRINNLTQERWAALESAFPNIVIDDDGVMI